MPGLGRLLSREKVARDAFCVAHEMLCGKPSGTTTWAITLSDNPTKWFYQARLSSRSIQGPKTARETIDPDCHPRYKNQVHLTDLDVHACISWHWAEDSFKNKPWEEAAAKEKEERMMVLGAVPLEPIPPADAAWGLVCIIHLGTNKKEYTAIQAIRYCTALGTHIVIGEFSLEGATQKLVTHVQQIAAKRLHGGNPSPAEWAEANMAGIHKSVGVPSFMMPKV